MTQVFTDDGESVAVTVIDLRPTTITQVKTKEKNGYQAIQVGFVEKKAKASNKPEQGHAKAVGAAGFYHYQEFRLAEGSKLDGLTVGKVLSAEFLKPGDFVDLTAMSKGKGFQGGMKRYHMAGGYKSHGASLSHRQLGSIGNRADPGKCFKNKKMAGHMGHERVTVQNVRVIRVDLENQLLLVHGSVPGPKSGIVTVQRAVKGE
ncbi:MAG: 50S ribosomal protein L3 [Oligoflexia bacterium]|nr:50S ribosomal protein L3 [Oligoflexia bacterium]